MFGASKKSLALCGFSDATRNTIDCIDAIAGFPVPPSNITFERIESGQNPKLRCTK